MNLTLKIITPSATVDPIECDSLRLTLSDDLSEKSGGAFGIRPGHTKALLALKEGPLEALADEKIILKGRHGIGFATVEKDEIKVVAESFEE